MTQLSESQGRSLAAIGDSCVIPAHAGIQRRWKTLDSRDRGNDGKKKES